VTKARGIVSDGLGAIVLASGEGQRLRPLTAGIPKPLLPVLGQTLLDRALDKIAATRPHRVVVALHHRADVVISHLAAGPHQVVTTVEQELTGPAGAVRSYGADPDLRLLLVVSGDLLFDDDLSGLVDHHLATGAEMTFATRRVRRASRFGVLETGPDGRVVQTREKPPVPDDEEHLVSAGIYCLSPRAVHAIPANTTFDFAAHLAPLLLDQGAIVQSHGLHGYWSDVGTPAALRDANLAALRSQLAAEKDGQLAAGKDGQLAAGKDGGRLIHTDDGSTYLSDGATVGTEVVFRGHNAVLGHARIGDGATVADSVVMGGAVVPAGGILCGALAWSPEGARP
jgi:NDP-sugar pyrophosphorylase family protein